MAQNHQPQIITPLVANAPFNKESISKAAEVFANTQNSLGQKLLATDFDLNQILFTWSFDTKFHSSFILVYTCKDNFYNDSHDQTTILDLMEESFMDPEINGDGEVDWVFNGVTLVVTIKHEY